MSISPSFHLYQNIHAIKLMHCYSLLLLPLTIARRLIFIHICAVLYLQLSGITILSMPIRVISFLKGQEFSNNKEALLIIENFKLILFVIMRKKYNLEM